MALNVIIPKCDSAINQTLVPSAAYTASDTAGPWLADFFSSAEITLVVTTCSGTLNLFLQSLQPDDTTYADIAAWPQMTTAVYTTTGTVRLSFVNGGNTIDVTKDGSLTANSVLTVAFGAKQRVKYTIAGTGATVTFGVFGNFRA